MREILPSGRLGVDETRVCTKWLGRPGPVVPAVLLHDHQARGLHRHLARPPVHRSGSDPVVWPDSYLADSNEGAFILGFLFAIGPVGGLVTGVISDINVLTGESTSGNPARNLYHPLLTNAPGSGVEGFSP